MAAEWKSFELQLPGKDILEPVRNVLEQLLIFLDILKAILETIKLFLIDFGNPIRALVEALIRLIEELFLALKTSGMFMLAHVPDPIPDPNFDFNRGYDSFVNVFKGSLFDTKDLNRPQPRPGSSVGGFVLLVVQADDVFALIARLKTLLAFFSKEFTSPRYEAPRNFKVSPVGSSGDPLLSVASVFADAPIESVSLTWTLPTSQETPDDGFSDLVNRIANEFVPSNYLIERTTDANPSANLIDVADITSVDKVGVVEFSRDVPSVTSRTIQKREILRDEYGEPIIKFTKYIVIDSLSITSLIGQLGKFRYIDTDIEADKTYYYRVRAFSGDLKFTGGGQIDWGRPKKTTDFAFPHTSWPSSSSSKVTPGKCTGIVSVRVPKPVTNEFDVLDNLNRVFQAAFTCDFHLEIQDGETDIPTGKGSLTKQAGIVAALSFGTLYALLHQSNTIRASLEALIAQLGGNPQSVTIPWQTPEVRKQSGYLADYVASAMLEAGSEVVLGFQSLMQEPQTLLGEPNLEAAVRKLTENNLDPGVFLLDMSTVFVEAFGDPDFREALLGVINTILPLTLRGIPPNWISVVPLRDIIPWSGQILYDLLDKIQALVDAFAGVVQEIKDFIDLLEQKIATLERTIEFLISILDIIEGLQFSVSLLLVPEVVGSVVDWVNVVDTAGGAVPLKGPGGYSGGVAIAYVAPNVTAFSTAFQIIFGG